MGSGEQHNRASTTPRDTPAIDLECPNPQCDNKASISAEYAGYTAHCRRCGETFKIRDSTSEASARKEPPRQKEPAPTASHPWWEDREVEKAAGKQAGPPLPEKIGRFHIRARLGAGAFGTVYRAYDPQLDREVALKVPQAGTLDTPKRVERFLGDAKAAARLRHPYIVPVYDAGWDGTHYYIASAFVEGRTLAEAMEGNDLTLRHSVQIVRGLAEALAYAHKLGIVHRDVKPANVMLDDKGQPHLIDFGLAHRRDSLDKEPSNLEEQGAHSQPELGQRLTQDGTILGTPAYMAPEQAIGKAREAQPASDQYSLGAMLYELLCGQTPFSGPLKILLFNVIHTEPPAPSSVKRGIPRDLEVICLKALAKRPEHRFSDCQHLADDLRRWLEGEPILARRPGRMERVVRWCRREPRLAGAVGIAAAAIMAVAGLSIAFGIFQSRAATELRASLDETEQQRELADRRAEETKFALASKTFDQGVNYCELGDTARGMTWLARSLQMAAQPGVNDLPEAKDLQHDIRVNLAGWRRRLHPLTDLRSHPDYKFWAMAYSPDGNRILTGSGDEKASRGEAQLWDGSLRKPIMTFKDPEQPLSLVRAVAFHPSGRLILTGSDDGTARLWDAATGKLIARLSNEKSKLLYTVAFSPDGQSILTACEDHFARIWETKPRSNLELQLDRPAPPIQVVKKFEHSQPVRAAAFSPDGHLILTGCGGQARLWNVATEKSMTLLESPFSVSAVAFSPSGKYFATGSAGLFHGEVQLWSTEKLQALHVLPHQAEVYGLAFSADETVLVTASQDRAARLWEVSTGKLIGQPLWHSKDVRLAALRPDGQILITDTDDRTARFWQVMPGELCKKNLPHQGPALAAVFSRDGKLIFTGSLDLIAEKGKATLWDAAGELIMTEFSCQDAVRAVAIGGDAKIVVTGSGSDENKSSKRGEVKVWDLNSKELACQPLTHPDVVWAAALSPDETVIATACSDGLVRLWDRKSGEALQQKLKHPDRVYAVAFSPDGKSLVTGCRDGLARLWKWNQLKWEWDRDMIHPDAVLSVAFSSDSKQILTGYAGGAQLWDAKTGQEIGSPFQHRAGVFRVAFSLDGRTVMTGGTDRTARLWDAITKKPLGPPLVHDKAVFAVDFHPLHNTVLTASLDMTAKIWERPKPVNGEVEQIVRWVQVITDVELDDKDVPRVLDESSWQEHNQSLEELGGPPDLERELEKERATRPPLRRPPVESILPKELFADPEKPAAKPPPEPPAKKPRLSPAGLMDPRIVIDKVLEEMGGKAKLAQVGAISLEFKGTVHRNGQDFPCTGEIVNQGLRQMRLTLHMDIEGQQVTIGKVLNGNKGWTILNDARRKMTADQLIEARHLAYHNWVSMVAPLEKNEDRYVLSSLGEVQVQNRTAVVIQVSRKGHPDVKLYFTLDTGLLAKSECLIWDEQLLRYIKLETFYSDYKEIAGLKQFMKIIVNKNGQPYLQGEIQNVRLE